MQGDLHPLQEFLDHDLGSCGAEGPVDEDLIHGPMRLRDRVGEEDALAQGEAIGRPLNGLGYGVSAVHAGKIFDLDVDTDDAAEAKRIGEEAAAKVLSNDLIEGYEVIVG
jgi:phosphoribosylformylglycinamidine (FGAM) synthase PurS component